MSKFKEQITFHYSNSDGDNFTSTKTSKDGWYQGWDNQMSEFVNFLYSQGFVISELKLAEHLLERAEEFGDLRGNSGVVGQEEKEDSYNYDEEFWGE